MPVQRCYRTSLQLIIQLTPDLFIHTSRISDKVITTITCTMTTKCTCPDYVYWHNRETWETSWIKYFFNHFCLQSILVGYNSRWHHFLARFYNWAPIRFHSRIRNLPLNS